MDNISELNIYPLNEDNLQALLDYFFPNLPKGNVQELHNEINGLILIELEYAAIKILPYISKVQDILGNTLTQTNALDYSIHVIFELFTEEEISPERDVIIKMIKRTISFLLKLTL